MRKEISVYPGDLPKNLEAARHVVSERHSEVERVKATIRAKMITF